ncbi:Protein of unknown function [Gryllus bimaculatus]|nr:Protein of unknown function [Gryllus bimaculatus]
MSAAISAAWLLDYSSHEGNFTYANTICSTVASLLASCQRIAKGSETFLNNLLQQSSPAYKGQDKTDLPAPSRQEHTRRLRKFDAASTMESRSATAQRATGTRTTAPQAEGVLVRACAPARSPAAVP